MKKKDFQWYTLAICLWCGQILGADRLTIDEAVSRAVSSHPQLAVARSNIAIAQGRLIDAGKLDNPIFEFSLTSQIADGPDREGTVFMGYSQKFPVTDKLLRQRDLGIADVKLASAEVHEAERKFILQVQSAYIDAVGAIALIDVLERLENESEEYIKLAKAQAQMALASELDVAAAETEKALATQSRILAECDYREAIAELKPLLGMGHSEDLRLSQSLNSVVSTLGSTVRYTVPDQLNRADVVAARVRQQRAKIDQKLARSERLEDWEVETGYQSGRSVDEPVGVERERFVGVGLKIPLPIRRKGQGRIAEAAAQSDKAGHEFHLAHTNALAEVRVRIAALCRVVETIDSLQERVLPQLKAREQKTKQAFEEGLVTFNQVILLRQQQSRIGEALIDAKTEQAHALSKLQSALGSNPCLSSFDSTIVTPYKPGTEPKSAPFALPAMRVEVEKMSHKIQAEPVKAPKQKVAKKNSLQGFLNRISKPRQQ